MKVFLIALALTAGALQAADCCNNCSCNGSRSTSKS